MKVPFFELIHNDAAGHLKFAKCVPHVMRRSWWLNWKTDLKLFIKCCPKCESFHRGQPPRQANLHPMLVGAPGERWHIDLCGPFSPSNGYKYLFTAICAFSKFGVCVPIRNKEAQTVAKAIVDHIFWLGAFVMKLWLIWARSSKLSYSVNYLNFWMLGNSSRVVTEHRRTDVAKYGIEL